MITNAQVEALKGATANLNLNDEVRMTNDEGAGARPPMPHVMGGAHVPYKGHKGREGRRGLKGPGRASDWGARTVKRRQALSNPRIKKCFEGHAVPEGSS